MFASYVKSDVLITIMNGNKSPKLFASYVKSDVLITQYI